MQNHLTTYSWSADERGFTLVEMMIALLVSLLIMAAVTGVFISHSRHYSRHDDLAGLQQTLRGILMVMPAEFRLAGCDPLEQGVGEILTATDTHFEFTADIAGNATLPNDADGDVNDAGERIGYRFENGTLSRQSQGNGGALSGFQPLADNLDNVEFNYILDDGSSDLAPTQPSRIRAVQISLLARSTTAEPNFRHTGNYTAASGAVWTPPQDGFRRRLVITTIQLRNMGY